MQTDEPGCLHIVQSGPRKGFPCSKLRCRTHSNDTTENEPRWIQKVNRMKTSEKNKGHVLRRVMSAIRMSNDSSEFMKLSKWINSALSFPFGKSISVGETRTTIMRMKTELDAVVYKMQDFKEEILSWVLSSEESRALAVVGPPGVGKTRAVLGIAKALNLPMRAINLGGLQDVHYLVGHSYSYQESKPGAITQALIDMGAENGILVFDELDKVSSNTSGQNIIGVLLHLTDKTQNNAFQDQYLDGIDLDFSKTLMIFTLNDESLVDPILRDRLKWIRCSNPLISDRMEIIQKHVLPDLQKRFETPFDISSELVREIVLDHQNDTGLRSTVESVKYVLNRLLFFRLFDEHHLNMLEMGYIHASTECESANSIWTHLKSRKTIKESRHDFYS